jgi:hypothetical protein
MSYIKINKFLKIVKKINLNIIKLNKNLQMDIFSNIFLLKLFWITEFKINLSFLEWIHRYFIVTYIIFRKTAKIDLTGIKFTFEYN